MKNVRTALGEGDAERATGALASLFRFGRRDEDEEDAEPAPEG